MSARNVNLSMRSAKAFSRALRLPWSERESLRLIREACGEFDAALLLVSHDREVLGEFEHREDLLTLNRAAQAREVAS